MKSKVYVYVLLALAVMTALLVSPGSVKAHGHTEVGDYELTIGFRSEPAYQGEPNGLDLQVVNHATGEPVTGLEDSLQVEIIFGSSRKELRLQPQFGREGAYTAYLLPTEPGDYTWHIFGTIGDTPVDVSMTSSPTTFSSVEPKSAFAFPSNEPAGVELLAGVNGANQMARTALAVGGGGLLVGLFGLILSVFAFRASRR